MLLLVFSLVSTVQCHIKARVLRAAAPWHLLLCNILNIKLIFVLIFDQLKRKCYRLSRDNENAAPPKLHLHSALSFNQCLRLTHLLVLRDTCWLKNWNEV